MKWEAVQKQFQAIDPADLKNNTEYSLKTARVKTQIWRVTWKASARQPELKYP